MRSYDICKFTSSSFIETLTTKCFVMETNMDVIRKPSKFNDHYMILISKGEGDFCIDEQKLPFTVGTLIFGFSGEKYWVESDKEVVYMYIRFSGNRAEELIRRFNVKKEGRIFNGYDGLIPLWNESLCRASDQTIDLAAESIVLYTFARLHNTEEQVDGLVNSIAEIAEKKFADPTLSVNAIAEQLSYNAKYLSHVFKKKMGISFSEYLRSVRIKFAVSLFDHGIDSVKNVAFLSGFYDPLYFSTVFKKAVGISPKEYRKYLSEKRKENEKTES